MNERIDVDALRAATPTVDQILHLDHAGASLMSSTVHGAVARHLELEAAAGGYRAAYVARNELRDFYDAAAVALSGHADEIAFQPSATHAWQAALLAFRLQPGDRILVHRTAYGTNGMSFLALASTGVVIEHVASRPDGTVDLKDLERKLPGAALVALTHIPTGSGLIQPAAAVGALCQAAHVPFLLDACQSLGQLALDVEELGCDVLTGTGRKYLRGPRGTGLLWVRRSLLELGYAPLLPDVTGATWEPEGPVFEPSARRFETFERFTAGQIGLGVALKEANALGWPAIEARIRSLGAGLRDRLGTLRGVTVVDDGDDRGGIVTFTVDTCDPASLRDALRREDVHLSVTTAGSARWHMKARGLESALRASVHVLNTVDELDRFAEIIAANR